MVEPFQCLLFVSENAKQGSLRKSSDQVVCNKSYVLLPGDFKTSYPKESKLFLKSDVEVISSDGNFSHLKNQKFEVIELMFEALSSKRLFLSVKKYNRQYVDLLFKKNACIETVQDYGYNFVRLVDEESFTGLRNFLKYAAEIILKHPKGGTLLHLAVKRRHEALVKLLTENSVDINAPRNDNSTSLHIAAKNWELQITQSLIENGGTVDAEKFNGMTPLHVAAERGSTEIVRFLLQKGANVHATINRGGCVLAATPLHCSIKGGHSDIAELLLSNGANVDAYSPIAGTCLLYAVNEGCMNIVETILKFHPDVNNECNQIGFRNVISMSHFRGKYKEVVEKMVQEGFNVSPEDANNFDLFFGAVCHNNVEIVRKLLEYGADVNECAEKSPYERPLHAAAEFAGEEMIKLLLDFGACVNARCGAYDIARTPVRYAIKHEKIENVRLLLKTGADILNDPEIAYAATTINEPRILELILMNGADANFENPKSDSETSPYFDCYRTPLLAAAAEGFLEVVEVLLKYGAFIDFCDNLEDKTTPLLQAIEGRHVEVFQTLLDCGFHNINLTSHGKFRRMMYALRAERYNREPELLCQKILVRHLLKMEAASLPVSNKFLVRRFKETWLNKSLDECKAEMANLKSEKVGDSNVTYYNILTQNVNQVARLVRNDGIAKTLVSKDYKERFPVYAGVIDWQFRKGYHRKNLLERGVKICQSPSNKLFVLPYDILEMTLDYLTDQQLLIFISSY